MTCAILSLAALTGINGFYPDFTAGGSMQVKSKKPPEELNKMADAVLRYRPKPKSKYARKRAKKAAKKGKG